MGIELDPTRTAEAAESLRRGTAWPLVAVLIAVGALTIVAGGAYFIPEVYQTIPRPYWQGAAMTISLAGAGLATAWFLSAFAERCARDEQDRQYYESSQPAAPTGPAMKKKRIVDAIRRGPQE